MDQTRSRLRGRLRHSLLGGFLRCFDAATVEAANLRWLRGNRFILYDIARRRICRGNLCSAVRGPFVTSPDTSVRLSIACNVNSENSIYKRSTVTEALSLEPIESFWLLHSVVPGLIPPLTPVSGRYGCKRVEISWFSRSLTILDFDAKPVNKSTPEHPLTFYI